MIGSIIGAGIGAAGAIFGGIQNAKAMRQAKANIEAQKQDAQNDYDRRFNEDYTQRADAQRLLTITEENIRQRNRQAEGQAAVMGSNPAAVAAAKAANNGAIADAVGTIAAQGEQYKQGIENRYLQQKEAARAALTDMQIKKAQNIAQATMGVASAGASMAGALDDSVFKKQ